MFSRHAHAASRQEWPSRLYHKQETVGHRSQLVEYSVKDMRGRCAWLFGLILSYPGCARSGLDTLTQGAGKGGASSGGAAAVGGGQRVADAASSSAPAELAGGDDQNPAWTLAWRMPAALAALEVPGDLFVSTVIESDRFEEGPLYLERRGSRLQGILDRTIVEGKLADGGGVELRDAVTHLVVFRGRAESTTKVTGTLYAESEKRVVRSAPEVPEPFPQGTFTFRVLRTSSLAESEAKLSRRASSVSGQIDGYGWLHKAPYGKAAKGTFTNDALHLTVGSESWTLRSGPGLFIGRVQPGHDVVVLRDPHKFARAVDTAPKTRVLGSGQTVVARAVKNKSGHCEVSLIFPAIVGTQNATEVNRVLAEQMVRMAMGPLAPGEGEPVPAPEKLRCSPGDASRTDPYLMSASYEAVDLGGGWVNLRLTGYARTGGARPTVGQDCVLVDAGHGKLYRSGELLSDAQRATLTLWVEQRLRMMARNAQLNLDDENYYANAAPVSERTSLCLTSEGLEVAFNPGDITKYMPTAGPSVFIPKKLLARLTTEGSVLAGVLNNAPEPLPARAVNE